MNAKEFAAAAGLGEVIGAIAEASAEIATKIRLAGLSDIYGAAGAVNVQGEAQQKLDVFANDVMIAKLGAVAECAAIVSEEDDEPVVFDHPGAKFVAIFDPLDGSSNIDVNVNVGTIVSIQAVKGDATATALQPGTAQVAALYVVYGPSTVMVVALAEKEGVAFFTLDDKGEFVLTAEGVKMPEQGPYYSTNEANAASWPAVYREYVATLVKGELGGKAYGARYIGSLVADFHRTILKGGVFLYPPTEKAPKGKLRLLYEANPLALIAEKADGAAVNGRTRILEVVAEQVHERTPLIVGSKREVEALQQMVLKAGK
ncbi:class 1 fructose-1,6-bisphosphatase [Granulicella cerasi]|uniref:Fructose-1,6-bisphosphatase class 1 n=1 Tax=Granulicella cerasi TaxID=741063 RepID=A0ABW1ZFZ4_9BACT|nr:class 1 fructose-bisphosphatase [Granulicella cerasi]